MECLWRLFGHWQQVGYCYQQDQAVFHVCLYTDTGVTDHYLHDTCLLEKYPQIHLGGKKEPLVLSLKKVRQIRSFNLDTTVSISSFVLCLQKENRTGTRFGLLLIALIT